MTATTALTAQNTTGVTAIHEIPPAFLRKQIDAVFDDMGVDVVKIGMLASTEIIATVAAALAEHGHSHKHIIVLDPVMVATTGAELLPHAALKEMRKELLPRTTVLTPNVPEARRLLADAGFAVCDAEIRGVEDLEGMGRQLLSLGPEWVLVKGGHAPLRRDFTAAKMAEEGEIVVDVLVGKDDQVVRIETPWQKSTSTHGTGCSLACQFRPPFQPIFPNPPRLLRF